MKNKLKFLCRFFLIACMPLLAQAQVSKKTVFYVFDSNVLKQKKDAVANNDKSLSRSFKQLVKDADKAMAFGPVSVMEKVNVPPSGDKHDYMSLAPYFWYDSSKPNGLPYMRRDGVTNPEVKEYKDKDYLPKLCEYVETLGLAYYFTGEEKYAAHAADLVRTWFIDTATKMNPNLNYGQAIKGRNDGRGAGLIDTRHLIKVISGIGLISDSKAWKKEDEAALKTWFASFLNWMETSANGRDELDAGNNHGVWYDAQRISMAAYLGNRDKVKEIVQSATNRLDAQLDKDGFFPQELARTISEHYSAFVLDAFFTIAQVANNAGVNFYDVKTASGKSLKMAFDTHKPFFTEEKSWTGEQIKPFDPEEATMILAEGAKAYKCKNCMEAITTLMGDKAGRLRINLLY